MLYGHTWMIMIIKYHDMIDEVSLGGRVRVAA